MTYLVFLFVCSFVFFSYLCLSTIYCCWSLMFSSFMFLLSPHSVGPSSVLLRYFPLWFLFLPRLRCIWLSPNSLDSLLRASFQNRPPIAPMRPLHPRHLLYTLLLPQYCISLCYPSLFQSNIELLLNHRYILSTTLVKHNAKITPTQNSKQQNNIIIKTNTHTKHQGH